MVWPASGYVPTATMRDRRPALSTYACSCNWVYDAVRTNEGRLADASTPVSAACCSVIEYSVAGAPSTWTLPTARADDAEACRRATSALGSARTPPTPMPGTPEPPGAKSIDTQS